MQDVWLHHQLSNSPPQRLPFCWKDCSLLLVLLLVLENYLNTQVLCSTHSYAKAINYTNPNSQVINNNLFLELISTLRIHQYLWESWNIPFWYASSRFSHAPQNILLLPMFFSAMSLAPSRIRFKDLQIAVGLNFTRDYIFSFSAYPLYSSWNSFKNPGNLLQFECSYCSYIFPSQTCLSFITPPRATICMQVSFWEMVYPHYRQWDNAEIIAPALLDFGLE